MYDLAYNLLRPCDRILRGGLRVTVAAYRLVVAPFVSRGCCRFMPSCSHYASEALAIHALPYALRLILRRLLHCHPFGGGGFDPVPVARPKTYDPRPTTDGI